MSAPLVGHEQSLSVQRSYRNLPVARVGALIALTAALLYQTEQQHLLLNSISAYYYYTPAQGVFVGAPIALGLAMAARFGTTKRCGDDAPAPCRAWQLGV